MIYLITGILCIAFAIFCDIKGTGKCERARDAWFNAKIWFAVAGIYLLLISVAGHCNAN